MGRGGHELFISCPAIAIRTFPKRPSRFRAILGRKGLPFWHLAISTKKIARGFVSTKTSLKSYFSKKKIYLFKRIMNSVITSVHLIYSVTISYLYHSGCHKVQILCVTAYLFGLPCYCISLAATKRS